MSTDEIAAMVMEQIGKQTVTFVPKHGQKRRYPVESCTVEVQNADTYLIKLAITNGRLELTITAPSIKEFDIAKRPGEGWQCTRDLQYSVDRFGYCFVTNP